MAGQVGCPGRRLDSPALRGRFGGFKMKSLVRTGAALSLAMLIAGCGSSAFDPPLPGSHPPPPPTPPPAQAGKVSGTISGLEGSGLILANAYTGETVAVAAGTTTFTLGAASIGFAPRLDYIDIQVVTSPVAPAQACTVTSGTGFVTESTSSYLSVQCSSDIGLVGGTITGLRGSGLELVQSNGDFVTPVAGATEFAFATGLAPGMQYSIGIGQQPVNPAQTCTIRRGKGAMPDAAGVQDIEVNCIDNPTSSLWGTYGFETSSGAKGYMTFFPDGTYSYVVRMDDPACGANNGNGVEYGTYRWDAGDSYDPYGQTASGPFAILNATVDTNGACGLARSVGGVTELSSGTLDWLEANIQLSTAEGVLVLTAVEQAPDQLLGSFEPGTAKVNAGGQAGRINRVSGAFTVFSNDGGYVSVETQDAPADDLVAGAEWGCATWGPYELEMTCYLGDPAYLDLNGRAGGLSARLVHGSANLLLSDEWLTVEQAAHQGGYLDNYWWRIGSGF